MFCVDTLIAITLLTAAPDASISKELISRQATLGPILQHIALGWEIMDKREKRYVLTRREDFESDVQLLRKRYRDLQNAPPMHDCVRFPTRKEVSEMLSFNREYRKHLKARISVDPTNAAIYQEALTETEQLYQIWDTIRDTRCEYYYVTVRRQALKKVKKKIGEVNFYNGNYPPVVPTWRFRMID